MARRSTGGRPRRVEEHHQRVAAQLIEQIEKGTAPWTQAWEPGQRALPTNVRTGKDYRGGNAVHLASEASERGWTDNRWGTFRQVREAGGQVRRGEKGTPVLFYQWEVRVRKRDAAGKPVLDAEGRPAYETRRLERPRVYRYTVYNAEQCHGIPEREPPRTQAWQAQATAERLLKASGATIRHTGEDRAFYDLRGDRIVLPHREQFKGPAYYYQSALHELGHWTGHQDRMNRQTLIRGLGRGLGSRDYAREELRAEISSMITGDRLGVGHDPKRHASYVGHWSELLGKDPAEIYRASAAAQRISDYTVALARSRDPEIEQSISPVPPARARPAREQPARPEPARPPPGRQQHLWERQRAGPSR